MPKINYVGEFVWLSDNEYSPSRLLVSAEPSAEFTAVRSIGFVRCHTPLEDVSFARLPIRPALITDTSKIRMVFRSSLDHLQADSDCVISHQQTDDIIQNMIPPSQVPQPPFSSDFQSSLDQMSFSNVVDWFPSPENNMTNLAVVAGNSRRHPSIPKSPSKTLNDSSLTPRRSGQAYIPHAEFLSTVRSIVDKLNVLQESLRDVQM
ncbi:hypothetical protein B7463_g3361, partial [Scytalidium lignicola]